jgi:hypothetical protein
VDGNLIKNRAGLWIAEIPGSVSNPNVRADARLVAAAPDLLSLVERFVSEAGNHNEDLADARALLAKVRG